MSGESCHSDLDWPSVVECARAGGLVKWSPPLSDLGLVPDFNAAADDSFQSSYLVLLCVACCLQCSKSTNTVHVLSKEIFKDITRLSESLEALEVFVIPNSNGTTAAGVPAMYYTTGSKWLCLCCWREAMTNEGVVSHFQRECDSPAASLPSHLILGRHLGEFFQEYMKVCILWSSLTSVLKWSPHRVYFIPGIFVHSTWSII